MNYAFITWDQCSIIQFLIHWSYLFSICSRYIFTCILCCCLSSREDTAISFAFFLSVDITFINKLLSCQFPMTYKTVKTKTSWRLLSSTLLTYQQHPKIIRCLVFISSPDQNTGPMNLTDPLSTQTLIAWFHCVVWAPNPRCKIRECNQLVPLMFLMHRSGL